MGAVPACLAIAQAAEGGKTATSQSLILIVLAVVGLSVAALLPRLRRRREAPHERPGAFGEGEERARAELERLLAEIQDLSREHIARLDTKIRLLTQLLAECDQKKKELETLLGRAASAGPSKPEPSPPPRPANPLHDQVWSLQDAGKDPLEICSATGLEKGEVDLILGLRRMPPSR